MRMLSRAVLLCLALILPLNANAGTPVHFWSKSMGGVSGTNCTINSITLAPGSGDIIVVGTFYGTVDFGGLSRTSAGGTSDAFITRYSPAGVLKWVRAFGGSTGSDAANDADVDASGNVVVVGYFTGSASLESSGTNISGAGQIDFFVMKLGPDGALIWNHGFGGTLDDIAYSVALDASGSVYVTGGYNGSATLGVGIGPVTSNGGSDVFVVKYNSSGVWAGQRVGGNTFTDYGQAIGVDASGNVYVTGYFATSISFGTSTITSAGSGDVFVYKFNGTTLVQQFLQGHGGTNDDQPYGMTIDATGFALCGRFKGTSNMGGGSLFSSGDYDGFVARYDLSGTHQWSFRVGSTLSDNISAVSSDGSGNLWATGSFNSPSINVNGTLANASGVNYNGFVARISSAGTLTWGRAVSDYINSNGYAVAADASGNAIVGGIFYLGVNLGGANLMSQSVYAGYLAKYGNADYAITSIKDVSNDQGRSVRIAFPRSPLDDGTAAAPVTEYRAYRRVLPLPSALAGVNAPHATDPAGQWEFAASVPASNSTTYKMIAPTLADSTISLGMYRSKFFVRAATSDPSLFYDTPVDSGYSLDNLAPSVPTNFAFSAGALNWDASKVADFDYYTVYGSHSNSFAAATVINYSITPTMNVTAKPYSFYYVTATDFAGNEGKPAKVIAVSGVGGTPQSYVLSVSAYPNPFNPETTVRYTLPSKSHVLLEVFGLNGEKVATLANEDRGAGAFTATWRGNDDAGRRVGSGVYFARLTASGDTRSYKLVLLK